MTQEIYVVYATYCDSLQDIYCYKSKENADKKRLELMKNWANIDSLEYYLKQNNLALTNMTIELYEDYFLIGADDIYVDYKKIVLED